MVVRNKLYRIFDKYRKLLKIKANKSQCHGMTLKGNNTKNKILDFYISNNCWPNRRSVSKREKKLGQKFENFMSKESGSYDSHFRRLVMLTGRKSNNKRSHDRKVLKKEILDFIMKYGRVPNYYGNRQEIGGESKLRSNLNRYTLEYGDMTFLGEVYSLDPCHRSGIPSKYRAIINESLIVEKPLIRLI